MAGLKENFSDRLHERVEQNPRPATHEQAVESTDLIFNWLHGDNGPAGRALKAIDAGRVQPADHYLPGLGPTIGERSAELHAQQARDALNESQLPEVREPVVGSPLLMSEERNAQLFPSGAANDELRRAETTFQAKADSHAWAAEVSRAAGIPSHQSHAPLRADREALEGLRIAAAPAHPSSHALERPTDRLLGYVGRFPEGPEREPSLPGLTPTREEAQAIRLAHETEDDRGR